MLWANPAPKAILELGTLLCVHGDNLYCVVVIVTEHWFYFQ